MEVAVCWASMMEGLRKSSHAAGRVDRFKGFGSFKNEPIDTGPALADGRKSLDEKTGQLSTALFERRLERQLFED